MPFRDPPGAADLQARIAAELRERLEEAIDAACLDAMVRARHRHRLPAPSADSQRDRAEYERDVRTLLEHLRAHFESLLGDDLRRRTVAAEEAERDPVARLMAGQLALARERPDYWQQFDAVRIRYAENRGASGGEGRGGLLGRLLGRG